MAELTYLESIILGAVQGVTEFLPVSSSAHLALTQRWLGLDPSSTTILVFDMLSHMGTLLAMAIVFGPALLRYLKRLVRESSPSWSSPNRAVRLRRMRERVVPVTGSVATVVEPTVSEMTRTPHPTPGTSRPAWRFLMLGVVASIITAAIGLKFKDQFEDAFARTKQTGVELMVTGLLLAVTARLPLGKRGWRQFGWFHAALIGFAQAVAILPGISRSGSTICTAAFCGIRRRWAGDFSFFIAAPAILGATVIKLKDAFDLPKDQLAAFPWTPILVGSSVSLIVGVISLRWLLKVIQRSRLHWFAPYCWLVGLFVLTGWFERLVGASAPLQP